MRINANISALNTHRQLTANQANTSRSVERLSSGLRINRAGDDAAGLAISEKMRGQIRGLTQASRNAQDGISLIQTAEGALTETHAILQRMRELAVQGSNDTLVTEDRVAIRTEITELSAELNRIAGTTQFNGQLLLNGSFGVSRHAGTPGTLMVGHNGVTGIDLSGARANTTYTVTATVGTVTLTDNATPANNTQTINVAGASFTGTLNFDSLGVSIDVANVNFGIAWTAGGQTIITGASPSRNLQIGANAAQRLSVSISDMGATALGVDALVVDTHTGANLAIEAIDGAITEVSAQRSSLGAWQNRLDHTINNLGTSAENLDAAESRIRDVDMAQEMMEFTRNNILSQAAQAMLAQANQIPQGVLQLLR